MGTSSAGRAVAGEEDFTHPLTVRDGDVGGVELVRELPGAAGLQAWQALRALLLWTREAPAARGGLFEAGAMRRREEELRGSGVDVALRKPLRVLLRELGRPRDARPERLARACASVSEWALDRGAPATALAYAEAGALAWPQSARYAWLAGRLLRAHGRPREAERWLRRAVDTAEATNDWEAHARALVAMGNLRLEQGAFPDSRRLQRSAVRVARRHELREPEAMALHDLYVVESHVGDARRAQAYADRAFELYGPGHPRMYALAHDVAYFWMDQGRFTAALYLLQSVEPRLAEPRERLRALANIARAAGGCGERETFRRASDEAHVVASQLAREADNATPLVEIALGASSLGLWSEAERTLERALAMATAAGEHDTVFRAEAALDRVRRRHGADARRRKAPASAEAFAQQMVGAL